MEGDHGEPENLRKTNLLFASGLDGEVVGLVRLIDRLLKGSGPAEKNLTTFSSFYKVCVRRMELFFNMESAVATTAIVAVGAAKDLSKEKLAGVEALTCLVDLFRNSVDEGVLVNPGNLKVFRTYQWCLPKEKKALTEQWHEAAMRQYIRGPANSLTDKSAIVDKSKDGGSEAASSSRASSSRRSPSLR